MASKPSAPKGMRDFLPQEMQRRNYIFSLIESAFTRYGFLPLETPSMEMLSTLTGKYGDEGDQLMFRVLNSGDFLSGITEEAITSGYKKLSPKIAEKALRYDLTIPFARVVATHQNEIQLPFRRYQIQPVWRADRPQKGRYREFYQCDADIVGSDSLILEAELATLYAEVFTQLQIPQVQICLNNRKILAGIAEICGVPERLTELTIALDKLDKIGKEGVLAELQNRNFSQEQTDLLFSLKPVFAPDPSQKPEDRIQELEPMLAKSEIGQKGIAEFKTVLENIQALSPEHYSLVQADFTLARGLNYYTGIIFEVKTKAVQMGSIGGGGRYDDLTGGFGLKGISGVGISFGADRIYDVLEELNAFPESILSSVKVLIANFGEVSRKENLKLLALLRNKGISAEYYPDEKKMAKQIEYALKKQIPWMILSGEEEIQNGQYQLKNLRKSTQEKVSLEQLLNQLNDK